MKFNLNHTPFLIVISAPSGSGKTTIKNEVLRRVKNLSYSISATTRKKREGEINGKDYIFLSENEFREWIRKGELIEWALIYGDFYGTPKSFLLENLQKGRDVLLDLDLNGKRALEKEFLDRVVSIFLFPPSKEVLEERLRKRGVENSSKLPMRLERISEEMKWAEEYEYWVMNDKIEHAVSKIVSIIEAERAKRVRIKPSP